MIEVREERLTIEALQDVLTVKAVEMTTTNTITLRFAEAPASGAYRVTVIG